LTKSHLTNDCFFKKACAQSALTSKHSESSVLPSSCGHQVDCCDTDNNTNDEVLNYFACVSNHYLCLVQSSSIMDVSSRHTIPYPIIVDKGANYHIFKEQEFFENITPAKGKVILRDGRTTLTIQGVGRVKCKISGNILFIDDVRYIPDLAESIFGLFHHTQIPQHGIHSSFEHALFITFTAFTTKTIIGTNDIYLDAIPFYDSTGSRKLTSVPGSSSSSFCYNLKNFQSAVLQESSRLDDIMVQLRLSIDIDSVTNDSPSMTIPIIHCVDKATSSLPNCITFTEDIIRSVLVFVVSIP
jgi:hypothetical protein